MVGPGTAVASNGAEYVVPSAVRTPTKARQAGPAPSSTATATSSGAPSPSMSAVRTSPAKAVVTTSASRRQLPEVSTRSGRPAAGGVSSVSGADCSNSDPATPAV